MLMLMNPGWLLSKTWAWIARLPFSLYQKTGAAVQEERQNSLPISLLFIPIVITIDLSTCKPVNSSTCLLVNLFTRLLVYSEIRLQKGGVPAAPSGTATLLRLSPNHRFCPRPFLAVTDFRHPRLSWLDGRCVQGPGTYSPRHG